MYSFSVQGKHLRNRTTVSRLGPIEFSAKTFTERRDEVKLVGIILWSRTEVHASRKILLVVTKCEFQEEEDSSTSTVMAPITRWENSLDA